VAHSGLRSERIRISRGGGIFKTSGENLYLLLSRKKEPKSLPPDTISGHKMYPECFCGRGPAPNPAGVAHSDRSHSWIWGPLGGREGGNGKGGNGREEGEEKVREGLA